MNTVNAKRKKHIMHKANAMGGIKYNAVNALNEMQCNECKE